MKRQARPRRAERIEISEAGDGFIVYDPQRDRLHHLNATAMLVLELCDGRVLAEDLPGLLAAAFQLPDPPVQEVDACLARLLQEGLLFESTPPIAGPDVAGHGAPC